MNQISGSDRMRIAYLVPSNVPDAPAQAGSRRNEPVMRSLYQASATAVTAKPRREQDSSPRSLAPTFSILRIDTQSKDAHQTDGAPASSTDSADYSDSSMTAIRSARPAYNDEQKFYIMYTRIVLGWSWPEIEFNFAKLFNELPRSRGGLTAVYYRIRKRWNLQEVLKTNPEVTACDRKAVHERAMWMSRDFLGRIGYRFAVL